MQVSLPMIRLDRVTKVFESDGGPVRALDGVTLEIARGEYVALRGPSGCGKSTLLSLVGGLAQATSGRVIVAGRDLAELTSSERAAFRANEIGFVFQMFHLLPYLGAVENVLVAAGGGELAEKTARAKELLTRFGLAERLDHRPGQMSAGERQRTALARALLGEPPLLVADEPTGNLDPASGAAVLDLIDEYHRAGGTVLLVTHDATAAGRAQRELVMDAGKIVERGTRNAEPGTQQSVQ